MVKKCPNTIYIKPEMYDYINELRNEIAKQMKLTNGVEIRIPNTKVQEIMLKRLNSPEQPVRFKINKIKRREYSMEFL